MQMPIKGYAARKLQSTLNIIEILLNRALRVNYYYYY